jgi:hypothetical protein
MDNSNGELPRYPPLHICTNIPLDPACKLHHSDPQSPRLLHLQHKPSNYPRIRTLHPPTPILDLGLRENQPALPGWTLESALGHTPSNRARNSASEISSC